MWGIFRAMNTISCETVIKSFARVLEEQDDAIY